VNIIDGIVGMEGEGPSRGNPINTSLIALSNNATAMDIIITKALNLPINFCKTNKVAIISGFDENNLKVEKNNLTFRRKIKKPLSYGVNFLPSFVRRAFAGKIYIKPEIDQQQCTHCKHCFKICPAKAISNNDNTLIIYKNLCFECFCCYEICEFNAIKLKRSLLHRVFVK
jgi:ferredoxin